MCYLKVSLIQQRSYSKVLHYPYCFLTKMFPPGLFLEGKDVNRMLSFEKQFFLDFVSY